MSTLSRIVACGGFLAVPALGALLVRADLGRRWRSLPELDRAGLAIAYGLGAVTLYLSALAHAGWFGPLTAGLPGWIAVAALGYAAQAGRREAAKHDVRNRQARAWLAAALVAGVVMAVLHGRGVDEPLAVGRDPQVYAAFGALLQREGRLAATIAPRSAADATVLATAVGGDAPIADNFPGALSTLDGDRVVLRSYLPATISAWIALARSVGGEKAGYAVNALFWPAGLFIAFVLAAPVLGRINAAVGALAVGILPPVVWSGGLTITEPLAFALAAGIALSLAHTPGRLPFAATGMLLLAAALVRIDALLLAVALLAAALLSAMTDADDLPAGARVRSEPSGNARAASTAARLALIGLGVVVLALTAYAAAYPRYLRNNGPQVTSLLVAIAVLAVACLWRPGALMRAGRAVIRGRSWILAAGIALALAFAYAAIVRPGLEPFALIQQGSGLDGTRDFREESVRNLARWISWPLAVGALGGLIAALARLRGGRVPLGLAFAVLAFAAHALLYLASPQVGPDHPWAIRRFLPVVIPGCVFMALYALVRLFGRSPAFARGGAGVLLALALVPFLAAQAWDRVLFRESAGLSEQVAALAQRLPEGLLVADLDLAPVALDLVAVHGRPVLPLLLADPKQGDAARQWIVGRTGEGVGATLLSPPGRLGTAGLAGADGDLFAIGRTRLAPTYTPPPTDLVRELIAAQAMQYRAVPFAGDRMFGGTVSPGLRSSGFYLPEVSGFGTFRWSMSGADLVLPAAGAADYDRLKVDFFALDRGGTGNAVALWIDDRQVLRETLPPGVSTRIIRLPAAVGDPVVVRLGSEVRQVQGAGSARPMGLGVGLIGMRFLSPADRLRPSTEGIAGFASRLTPYVTAAPVLAPDAKSLPVMLRVENTGVEPWPTWREQGRVEGGVRIGGRWYRVDGDVRLVGDGRWQMEVSLLPGDSMTVATEWPPVDVQGRRLPPGRYQLRIGLVRDEVAWFADSGDPVVVLPVTVE